MGTGLPNAINPIFDFKFIFVGYSLRLKEGIHLDNHKPGCRVITVDRSLHHIHPALEKTNWERIGNDCNAQSELRYNIDAIKDIYMRTANKSDYSVFGYAIDRDDILKYDHLAFHSYNTPEEFLNPSFSYALVHQREPDGIFLGYDVFDIDTYCFSILSNCEWEIAEKCGELNRNNLFSDYKSALCHKNKAKDLEETHAPYAIWAIYLIDPDKYAK